MRFRVGDWVSHPESDSDGNIIPGSKHIVAEVVEILSETNVLLSDDDGVHGVKPEDVGWHEDNLLLEDSFDCWVNDTRQKLGAR